MIGVFHNTRLSTCTRQSHRLPARSVALPCTTSTKVTITLPLSVSKQNFPVLLFIDKNVQIRDQDEYHNNFQQIISFLTNYVTAHNVMLTDHLVCRRTMGYINYVILNDDCQESFISMTALLYCLKTSTLLRLVPTFLRLSCIEV